MNRKRILLMFISEISGHREAARAVEAALHRLNAGVETLNINAFNYTNPVLEKIINSAYMGVVKNVPQLWNYLYDNPKLVKNTQKLKNSINKSNAAKIKRLIDGFSPDGVVCTQAFPCGIVADFKKENRVSLPIVGVLTDYAPHSYWVYDNVDAYIVPCDETGRSLASHGVAESRIKPFGIPISPDFSENTDSAAVLNRLDFRDGVPVVLIMGGGQGLGPIKKIVANLQNVSADLQMIVVCGSNKRLYRYFNRRKKSFRKKTAIFAFADNVNELMSVSSFVITKPGGLTTAEALSKSLPMIIINPLPGQEALNTNFLLSKGLAARVDDEDGLVALVEEFLRNPAKLGSMKAAVSKYANPDAAARSAELILSLVGDD